MGRRITSYLHKVVVAWCVFNFTARNAIFAPKLAPKLDQFFGVLKKEMFEKIGYKKGANDELVEPGEDLRAELQMFCQSAW